MNTSLPKEETGKLNVLVAYPYLKNDILNEFIRIKDDVRWICDSGAFTAWKAGKPIALDDYCKFLESLPVQPWRYFTLDVVGDPHASLKNYQTMLDRGFKPVPIFTRGEDLSVLEDYYKTSDVVGIGGLVATQGNKGFVNRIMRQVGDRRVHWLGFTNIDFVKHYRPYMCDSSSWESGARYGIVKIYKGSGTFVTLKKSQFKNEPTKEIYETISKLNINPHSLCDVNNWHGGPSVSRNLCAASGVALSLDIEKNLKTKFFNAFANKEALQLLIKHYFLQTQKDIK